MPPENNTSPATPNAYPAQEKIARIVSIIVLTGTCVLGSFGMSMGIVAMAQGRSSDA